MTATVDPTSRRDRFAREAARAGSIVHLDSSREDLAELLDRLGDGSPGGPLDVPGDLAVATEVAILAIAETGSVLVAAGPDEAEPPGGTYFARRLVQVVEDGALVDSLDDLAAWLELHAADGPVSLVTGPSRTADIERVLTVGVQGPEELHVVVLVPDGTS